MQEKYDRVIACSLLCVRLVISMTSSDRLEELSNKLTTVLDKPAFWKYGSSTVPMVHGQTLVCYKQFELKEFFLLLVINLCLY